MNRRSESSIFGSFLISDSCYSSIRLLQIVYCSSMIFNGIFSLLLPAIRSNWVFSVSNCLLLITFLAASFLKIDTKWSFSFTTVWYYCYFLTDYPRNRSNSKFLLYTSLYSLSTRRINGLVSLLRAVRARLHAGLRLRDLLILLLQFCCFFFIFHAGFICTVYINDLFNIHHIAIIIIHYARKSYQQMFGWTATLLLHWRYKLSNTGFLKKENVK
jgi:hypothetical protein